MDTVYGEGTQRALKESNVLVVGAGGVGCELLKNLGVVGFEKITLIDLDTIDVSNLNRQFLFRREHVGKPKAEVAALAVENMLRGRCKVEPIVGNVKDGRFSAQFFEKFDVVLNALDNLDARRHVNRMCLAAKVPMVESGSTGYLGQVTVVHPHETECYDCQPVPAPKIYAVCTIRSTPEKPVHCVVWAKQLLELLFGPEDESNLLSDLAKGDETSNSLRWDGVEPSKDYVERVTRKVFYEDILKQREVSAETWKSRPPPEPLLPSARASSLDAPENYDLLDQGVWSLDKTCRVLMQVVQKFIDERKVEIGNVRFDKDDDDMLAFVVSTANLRAYVYGVETSSPFKVKGIAGNIIHAIATTNAMVAGLIVLECVKVVVGKQSSGGARAANVTTYVKKFPNTSRRGNFLLQASRLDPPNPACYVCSKGSVNVRLNTDKCTLGDAVAKLLRDSLGLINPCVCVTNEQGSTVLFESGEGLDDDELEVYSQNGKKSLAKLGVADGAVLEVSDFSQNMKLSVNIIHDPELGLDEDLPMFDLKGEAPRVHEENASAPKPEEKDRKRRREDDGVLHVPSKRQAVTADMVVIE